MIEITAEQLDRIRLLLNGVYLGAHDAIYNVQNRAIGTIRSVASKEIRKTYKIKHKDLTSNQNIKVVRAGRTKLEAAIYFNGNLIPLVKFDVVPKQPQRKTVSASIRKGSGRKQLAHAYVANLRYGVGTFERETSERDSSRQLYGPAAAIMVGDEAVLERIEQAATETIDKRVEHEISRILNGYKGGR